MMSFSPLAIDSPGTDVASPSTPAATSVSAAVSWASASPPAGPVTSMLTPRSSAANCAASMICWMNGFPTTWVTNPIFRSSAGAPESGAEAPAAPRGMAPAASIAAAIPIDLRVPSGRRRLVVVMVVLRALWLD